MTLQATEPMVTNNIQYRTRVMSKRDLSKVLSLMQMTAVMPPPEDVLGELFVDEHTTGIVAETMVKEKSRIIGHLFVTVFDDRVVIQDCMVHPKYARLGIGTTLIDYAKRTTEGNCLPRLVNHCGEYNLGGQLFLRDQGFRCSEQETLGGHTFLNMEWTPEL